MSSSGANPPCLSSISQVMYGSSDYEYAGYNYQAFDIGNHFNEFAGEKGVTFQPMPKTPSLRWGARSRDLGEGFGVWAREAGHACPQDITAQRRGRHSLLESPGLKVGWGVGGSIYMGEPLLAVCHFGTHSENMLSVGSLRTRNLTGEIERDAFLWAGAAHPGCCSVD